MRFALAFLALVPAFATATSTVDCDALLALKKPKIMTEHGHDRVDNYYWMNERDSDDVLKQIARENEHTDKTLKPIEGLQTELENEMAERAAAEHISTPTRRGQDWYMWEFKKGEDYGRYLVRRGSLTAEPEVLLDENLVAQGHEYSDVKGVELSPSRRYLSYSVDFAGRRIYTTVIRDLKTGEDIYRIENTTGNFAWGDDDTVFFTRQDLQTLRPYQVFRRHLKNGDEKLVRQEDDPEFNIWVARTKAGGFIFSGSQKRETSEVAFLSTKDLNGEFQVFAARETGIEYGLDDGGDRFFVQTDYGRRAYRLMEAPLAPTPKEKWKPVYTPAGDSTLDGVTPYRDFIALSGRENGLPFIRTLDRKTQTLRPVVMAGAIYEMNPQPLPEYDESRLRFTYSSPTQPTQVWEQEVVTGQRELLKTNIVPNFNPDLYETRREFAVATDGTKIPISILQKKGTVLNGKNPLLLQGYGAYGSNYDVDFNPLLLSYVDRGFVVAFAHVRGGAEFGRAWHDGGRMENKINTFTDFIASAETLIAKGYTSPQHQYAEGGSAGGLLMGAITNMRPDLFHGVIADVPFVDVVTTMLDDSLPLTTGEYNEWGNPHELAAYERMLAYSPYDNLRAKDYPNILVVSGYEDSQVQYFEPMKYVAKLREIKTDNNLLLLDMNMGAGHGGKSGRLGFISEYARRVAFILGLENGTLKP